MRKLRFPALILCLSLFAVGAEARFLLDGANPVPTTGNSAVDKTIYEDAMTKGGLVTIILIIVWSYRRDWERLFKLERERSEQLLAVLTTASTALATHTEATRAQTTNLATLNEAVRSCEVAQALIAHKEPA